MQAVPSVGFPVFILRGRKVVARLWSFVNIKFQTECKAYQVDKLLSTDKLQVRLDV